jgi:hypothetical protein
MCPDGFWASWIRIRIRNLSVRIWIRIQILPSTSKKMQKNLDFYCFVTSLWFFIFEEWYKCIFKKESALKLETKKIFFVGNLKVTIAKSRIRSRIRMPLVKGMDPRIRIRTKMSRIQKTEKLLTFSDKKILAVP